MKSYVLPFDLRSSPAPFSELRSIGDDLLLFDSSAIASFPGLPVKSGHVVSAICTCGRICVAVNTKEYVAEAPCMLIVHSRQTLRFPDPGSGFQARFLIMSEAFAGELFDKTDDTLPIFLSVYDCPFYPIDPDSLNDMNRFYDLIVDAVEQTDNPLRNKVVRHLLKANFYSRGHGVHRSENSVSRPGESIVDRFFPLLGEYYKTERGVEFYAGKLFITPKYLSRVIRDNTGKTVSDWIEEYVVAEIKSMLGSTGLTIQQISHELNFPSQSFLGKYFRRIVGVSPGDYRKSLRNFSRRS